MTTMYTVPEVLAGIANLISDPTRWMAGERIEAQDVNGEEISPNHPNATVWTIGGAITRLIDPQAVHEDGDDAEADEWDRRVKLECATYHALGIATDRADGGWLRHDVMLLALNQTRDRLS